MSMATKTNELLIVAEEGTCSITNSTRIPDIPNEIIVEILSRLPVKSLLRFRCVCMSWLALISNRQFIKKHLHMSTTDHNNKYSRHRLIYNGCKHDFRIRSCSLDSIYHDLHIDSINHDHTSGERNWANYIVGSYDGLILIISPLQPNLFLLWNPSLKKSKRLPNVGFKVHSECGFGIGYDYSIDDYKVVAMSLFEVGVYTLRTNSWKRIGLFPRGWPDNGSGHFVSGALHWTSGKNFPAWTIVALDLATETYHEVAPPVYGDNKYDPMLGLLRECLCVMIKDQTRRLTNLWIMKEYGVGKPWTKLASIPYFMSKTLFCPNKTPLFISEKGELLFVYKYVIYLCNLKDNSFRYPVTDDNFFAYDLDSTIYIESLVSPNADDTTEKRQQCNINNQGNGN